MIRERPLTWLFVIATVCVDLVICVIDVDTDFTAEFCAGLFLGQSLVLSSYLAIGVAHRLTRGAIFVVGHILLAFLFCFSLFGSPYDHWGHVIALFTLNGFSTFLGAFLCLTISFLLRRVKGKANLNQIRFPIIELFGWTIVVAIASAVARRANFSNISVTAEIFVILISLALLTGFISALLVPTKRFSSLKILGSTSMLVFFFVASYQANPGDEDITSLLFAVIYAALWIVVQRLDALSIARTVPQTSSDD